MPSSPATPIIAAPDFTVTPQPDGRLLIAWPASPAADYRVYAAKPGEGYELIGVATASHTSLVYDAPVGVPLYLRVYADTPAGPSTTRSVGPVTRAAPASIAPPKVPAAPVATPPSKPQPASPVFPVPVAAAPIAPAAAPAAPAQPPTLQIVCAGSQAPAVVHVDLTRLIGAPATAADLPLLQTDFGDPLGAYNQLPGFNAAHLYTRPGKYTITARVTRQDPVTLAQSSSTFTASVSIAPDARRYVYASAIGNDANPGTAIAPVLSFARAVALATTQTAHLPDKIESAGVLLRRGDVFDVTASIGLLMHGARFADFGDASLPPPRLRYAGPRASSGALIAPAPGSDDVIIQDLAFDSIYNADTDYIGNLTAFQPAGSNNAIVSCQFLNVSCAVNGQSLPDGLLVQRCWTPQIAASGALLAADAPDTTSTGVTGVRAYTVYVEGSHVALLGNTVADSTREHAFRVGGCSGLLIFGNDLQNLDRTAVDTLNISKGTLPMQIGDHAWVANNTFRVGPLGVGPLNRLDLLQTPEYEILKAHGFTWAVVENNTFQNTIFIFQPGAQHVIVRNNLSLTNGGDSFLVNGYTAAYDRDVTDAHLLHNTAINTGVTGRFLVVDAPLIADPAPPDRALATGITIANNLYAATGMTVGKGGAAPVYIQEADLRSFTVLTGNIWPTPASRLPEARDGINYVLPGINLQMTGYLNAAAWAKLGAAGDHFQTIAVASDGTTTAPPAVPNVKGSFTTRDGTPRNAMTTAGAK